ncbi:MAG: S8 family peptidase [Bacteroidota bacterium]
MSRIVVRGVIVIAICTTGFGKLLGQTIEEDSSNLPVKEWLVLDPQKDKMQGVSANKAYATLLKGKPSRKVTVAVIDSGVDIDHEDLKGKIWINEDEIEGNGVDDDNNGYVDDRYGWNFIGGKEGNVEQDTYELTRIYKDLKAKYKGVEEKKVKKKNKEEYKYWLKVKKEFEPVREKAQQQYQFYSNLEKNVLRYHNLLKAYLDVEKITMEQLRNINTADSTVLAAQGLIGLILQNMGSDVDFEKFAEELKGGVEYFGNQVNYAYNTDFDPRKFVNDDYDNLYEKGYGNNDVKGHDPSHGTHVAGIIAANRENGIGIDGIAGSAEIMVIRAVPDGDERDKDIANAIIYAVDNGAQIINMSFGKSYSPQKEAVDKAVKYAEKKGVLLVHAAGNSSKNIDKGRNFPTKRYSKSSTASNWLEIGASSWGDDENFVGSFSNFGKETVDVFAPGVQIYSTTPDNTYKTYDGTSMAAPATSGVAALLMSYFPDLSASQVKDIILKSSRRFDNLKVFKPGKEDEKIDFSELSITGGIINAYEAVKLAQEMSVSRAN